MRSVKKSLWLVSIICASLVSAEVTEEEIARDKAELEAATKISDEAKAEIAAAKAKLSAAKKRIEKVQEHSEEAQYSTKTELSFSDTQGNTDTSRFGLNFHGERKRKKNTMTLDITALQSSSDGVEDNNKWNVLAQYDRDLTKKLYFNYLISYGKDKFSGFDSQFNTGPGFGYKAINTDAHKLNLRANALYSKDEIENGGTNEYASWVAGFKYKWAVAENVDFLQDAYFKSQMDQFENYFVYSKTAIESKINGTFSLGMSYQVDYKNEPAEDKKRTDRVFLATLIINY